MTTSTSPTPTTATPIPAPAGPVTPAARPRLGVGRSIALGIGTLTTALLPVVWGVGAAAELLTGTETDHRFHQVTGQGVLLSVLWLAGLLPLITAGWRRRIPSPVAGLHHLAFVAAAVVAAALAPGNGGAAVAVSPALTAGLLWAALPQKPAVGATLRAGLRLDPVLAPLALLTAAVLTPYVLDQAAQQRAFINE